MTWMTGNLHRHTLMQLWENKWAFFYSLSLYFLFLFVSYVITTCVLMTGIITSYGLWLDGVLILNSSSSQRFTVVDGLSPWSRHIFRLQACTARGCGKGPMVSDVLKLVNMQMHLIMINCVDKGQEVLAVQSSLNVYENFFSELHKLCKVLTWYLISVNEIKQVKCKWDSRLRHLYFVCGLLVTTRQKGDRFSLLDNEGWRGDSDIW